MAKILAFDTSTNACSAALLIDDNIFDRFLVVPAKHTKFILPMIQELLQEAKLEFKDLSAIAFGHGPGSFTGVRLAASIVQGLAFAAKLPVIGISTLRTIAQEVLEEEGKTKVIVALDARMQEVYWGEYGSDNKGIMQPIIADKLIKPSDATVPATADFVLVGNGFEIYKDSFPKSKLPVYSREYVKAKYMLRLAAFEFDRKALLPAEKALPVYLREKVAWV
jgi:tRNA threonylcarbamoyladenosine biosynthesis protein TsaB